MQDKKLSFAIFGNEYQAGKSVGIEHVLSSLYECDAEIYVDRPFYEYLSRELNVDVKAAGVVYSSYYNVNGAIAYQPNAWIDWLMLAISALKKRSHSLSEKWKSLSFSN